MSIAERFLALTAAALIIVVIALDHTVNAEQITTLKQAAGECSCPCFKEGQ